MTLRRLVQAACLALFIVLLWLTAMPAPSSVNVAAYTELDPAMALGAALAAGTFALIGLPLVLLLAGTAIFGRFFCSHVCPFGTTLDMARPVFGRGKSGFRPPDAWRKGKYFLLVFLAFAALYGANLTHFGTPISLSIRLYALVLRPAAKFLSGPFTPALHRLSEILGVQEIYGAFELVRYSGLLVIVPLLFALLYLVRYAPRFWCRYLCPSGAIFAIVGARPVFRRNVSGRCTACGKCVEKCPAGAIRSDDPRATNHPECIACRTCRKTCPENAITFSRPKEIRAAASMVDGSRRYLIGAAFAGLFAAFAAKAGVRGARSKDAAKEMPDDLVRPPGAKPEPEFLALCTRCSLCIKACPTNMLQPGLLEAGLDGLFAPLAVSRSGPCESLCNACGQVCPTGAITGLPLHVRPWAKMGTAVITRRKCLAWEFDKSCLVCDEACPYDAIKLVEDEEHEVEVPIVEETRCSGCGYCENKCPVTGRAAVRVTPMGALRLPEGEPYPARAREAGLSIRRAAERKPEKVKKEDFEGAPPGFDE
jgi:MauM/NapG family ferredoxin protein